MALCLTFNPVDNKLSKTFYYEFISEEDTNKKALQDLLEMYSEDEFFVCIDFDHLVKSIRKFLIEKIVNISRE